jgi:hypothetical protein
MNSIACTPQQYWHYPKDRESRIQLFSAQEPKRLISRRTPVISLGSCFADHIRLRLKDRGFNYIITEPNDSGASANWGRVYNPISMRQVLDYCENRQWRPAERWWRDAHGRVVDPYRAVPPYPDESAAESDFQWHQEKACEAVASAEVVILTYGLVEIWESLLDNVVFQVRPIAYETHRHRFRVLEYPECLAAIEATCSGIRRLNPAAAIILTVSPVPLRATFRPDVTAVTANCYSKAVLIAAAQTAADRMPYVHYFPSYEIVNDCADVAFRLDGGIDSKTVDLVMNLFEKQFAAYE